jgi:hypothetical protein
MLQYCGSIPVSALKDAATLRRIKAQYVEKSTVAARHTMPATNSTKLLGRQLIARPG